MIVLISIWFFLLIRLFCCFALPPPTNSVCSEFWKFEKQNFTTKKKNTNNNQTIHIMQPLKQFKYYRYLQNSYQTQFCFDLLFFFIIENQLRFVFPTKLYVSFVFLRMKIVYFVFQIVFEWQPVWMGCHVYLAIKIDLVICVTISKLFLETNKKKWLEHFEWVIQKLNFFQIILFRPWKFTNDIYEFDFDQYLLTICIQVCVNWRSVGDWIAHLGNKTLSILLTPRSTGIGSDSFQKLPLTSPCTRTAWLIPI